MKGRMPERARTDPREPQGSNPLGPPGPELLQGERFRRARIIAVDDYDVGTVAGD